jgi:hypothetical protein
MPRAGARQRFATVFASLQCPSCPPPALGLVSFTDSEGIRHAVEVAASSLYEAAALAIGAFRRCGFTANAPGAATRLTVTVKAPTTSHEVRLSKIEACLQSGGRSPKRTGDEGEIEGVARGVTERSDLRHAEKRAARIAIPSLCAGKFRRSNVLSTTNR